jgi:putative flippase GtrA
MRTQFLRFAIAGAIGFFVDAGVLYGMLRLGAGPYAGRLVSFLCAVIVTWQINRRYTFSSDRKRSLWREWNEYLLAMIFGGICNYAVYVLAVKLLPASGASPLVGVAFGSIAGMVVNFVSAKLWVFRQGRVGGSR